jgi:hypothetical protein
MEIFRQQSRRVHQRVKARFIPSIWGKSLIVGNGSTFADGMQHQVANLVGSTDAMARPLSWLAPLLKDRTQLSA